MGMDPKLEAYVYQHGGDSLQPLPDALGRVHRVVFDICCTDQLCEMCDGGLHPQLPSGFKGVFNTLGWMLMCASDAVRYGGHLDGKLLLKDRLRERLEAAMPFWADFCAQVFAGDGDGSRPFFDAHPEYRDFFAGMAEFAQDDTTRAVLEDLGAV